MAQTANAPNLNESSKKCRFRQCSKKRCGKKFGSNTTATEVLKDLDLAGKTILITGTTNGIGVETARSLALSGAHVVMANRSLGASEKLRLEIIGQAKGMTPNIDIIQLDLLSLKSVRDAANAFISKGWPLHALVLNAGLTSHNGELSAEGHERTFAVNHLGHFYLAQLLMGKLRESAPSRLVIVSSNLHAHSNLRASEPLETKLQKLAPSAGTPFSFGIWNSTLLYNNSKLCNMLFAKKAHKIEHHNGVNVYVLHPGIIRTELGRDNKRFYNIFTFFAKPFMKSVEAGAATTVYCAAHPDAANESGSYYVDCAEADTKANKDLVNDEQLQDALWEKSNKLIREFESSQK